MIRGLILIVLVLISCTGFAEEKKEVISLVDHMRFYEWKARIESRGIISEEEYIAFVRLRALIEKETQEYLITEEQ